MLERAEGDGLAALVIGLVGKVVVRRISAAAASISLLISAPSKIMETRNVEPHEKDDDRSESAIGEGMDVEEVEIKAEDRKSVV